MSEKEEASLNNDDDTIIEKKGSLIIRIKKNKSLTFFLLGFILGILVFLLIWAMYLQPADSRDGQVLIINDGATIYVNSLKEQIQEILKERTW